MGACRVLWRWPLSLSLEPSARDFHAVIYDLGLRVDARLSFRHDSTTRPTLV